MRKTISSRTGLSRVNTLVLTVILAAGFFIQQVAFAGCGASNGGGGGGGCGYNNPAGGIDGAGTCPGSTDGGAGSSTAAGAGGACSTASGGGITGGAGGCWGVAGSPGTYSGSGSIISHAGGGAAGAAIVTNGNALGWVTGANAPHVLGAILP